LAVHSGLTGSMTFLLPPFAGGFQLAVASCQNLLVTPLQLVLGCDVTDGRMQTNRVVVFDKLGHDPSSVFQGQRCSRTNALFLEDAMPAFNFAVALGVVRRGPRRRHTANADELLVSEPGTERSGVSGLVCRWYISLSTYSTALRARLGLITAARAASAATAFPVNDRRAASPCESPTPSPGKCSRRFADCDRPAGTSSIAPAP
jgi:hypothetical protein